MDENINDLVESIRTILDPVILIYPIEDVRFNVFVRGSSTNMSIRVRIAPRDSEGVVLLIEALDIRSSDIHIDSTSVEISGGIHSEFNGNGPIIHLYKMASYIVQIPRQRHFMQVVATRLVGKIDLIIEAVNAIQVRLIMDS